MNQNEENQKPPESKRKTPRQYPKHSLETALIIAEAIQDKNAGKPMKKIFVAEAIGRKPMSSEFKDLLSSSYKYGLTLGTEKSENIELTPLGHSITKPKSEGERSNGLIKAVENIELFNKIFDHYKNSKYPTGPFFKNILEREYEVPREWVDNCTEILNDNGRYSGIIRDVSGSLYVILDKVPSSIESGSPNVSTITEPEENSKKTELPKEDTTKEKEEAAVPQKKAEQTNKGIFIAHGKNKIPTDQLKSILDQFKIPYKIAIEEPHKGRPISQKVGEIMKNCSSAIFIFTADEEYQKSDGTTVYRPSDNIVYELGAASILYDNRIVIFKEDNVEFASNFKDFGYISFEKDRVSAKATELLSELIGFGLLKVVTS
jgi:predicted nucleotide-binding protein